MQSKKPLRWLHVNWLNSVEGLFGGCYNGKASERYLLAFTMAES